MVGRNTLYPLDLCFKGRRDYLAGTDIISAVLALSGPVESISFQIHRMTTSHPLMAQWLGEQELEKLRQSQQLCALMTYVGERQDKRMIAVTEDVKGTIEKRVPYKEELVTDSAYIIGKKILHEKAGSGNFIERIIALNKELINTVVENQQLVVMRLDLLRVPLNPHSVAIELIRVIGDQTFISTIVGDGEKLGSIYFAKRL